MSISRDEYLEQIHSLDPARLTAWLYQHVRDWRAAEGLVSDLYLRLRDVGDNSLAKISGPDSVSAYACGVARYVGIDWVRERARARSNEVDVDETSVQEELLDTSADPQRITEAREELQLLCSEIAQLPRKCRQVVTLIKVYGYSARRAAEKLDIAESTAKKHLESAYGHCHAGLDAENPENRIFLLSKVFKRFRRLIESRRLSGGQLKEPTER